MSHLRVLQTGELTPAIVSGSVLVDFGAPGCGPCRALEPMLVQLGQELAGHLVVVKVDIEATPELAAACGVMSVPTLLLFKDGKKLASRAGAPSLQQLHDFVRPAL